MKKFILILSLLIPIIILSGLAFLGMFGCGFAQGLGGSEGFECDVMMPSFIVATGLAIVCSLVILYGSFRNPTNEKEERLKHYVMTTFWTVFIASFILPCLLFALYNALPRYIWS